MNVKYRKDAATGHKWTLYINGKAVPRNELEDHVAAVIRAFEEKIQSQQQIIAGVNFENAKLDQQVTELKEEIEVYKAMQKLNQAQYDRLQAQYNRIKK